MKTARGTLSTGDAQLTVIGLLPVPSLIVADVMCASAGRWARSSFNAPALEVSSVRPSLPFPRSVHPLSSEKWSPVAVRVVVRLPPQPSG